MRNCWGSWGRELSWSDFDIPTRSPCCCVKTVFSADGAKEKGRSQQPVRSPPQPRRWSWSDGSDLQCGSGSILKVKPRGLTEVWQKQRSHGQLQVWPEQLEDGPAAPWDETQGSHGQQGVSGRIGVWGCSLYFNLRWKPQGLGTWKERRADPEACVAPSGKQCESQRGEGGPEGSHGSMYGPLQALLPIEPGPRPWLAAHRPISQVGKLRELTFTVSTSLLEAGKRQDEVRWGGR